MFRITNKFIFLFCLEQVQNDQCQAVGDTSEWLDITREGVWNTMSVSRSQYISLALNVKGGKHLFFFFFNKESCSTLESAFGFHCLFIGAYVLIIM